MSVVSTKVQAFSLWFDISDFINQKDFGILIEAFYLTIFDFKARLDDASYLKQLNYLSKAL